MVARSPHADRGTILRRWHDKPHGCATVSGRVSTLCPDTISGQKFERKGNVLSARNRVPSPQYPDGFGPRRNCFSSGDNASRLRQSVFGLIAAVTVPWAAGCASGSPFVCVRYPEFWQPELKRVAVIPFASRTGNPGDGALLAGLVQAELVRNGTYEVFSREQAHLSDIDSEKVLAMIDSGQTNEAGRIGKLTTVQAIIVGTVNQCGFTERHERITNQVPAYQKNAAGKSVVVGYRNTERIDTTIVATVQCQVHVLDTGSGKVLASAPVSLTGTNKSLQFLLDRTGPAILNKLQARAVDQIVGQVAPTSTRARLPANSVRTATGRYDGKWDWQRKISAATASFSVVLRLPAEAARNNFRVAIVPREGREVLSEQRFTWPEGTTEQVLSFDVGPIAASGGYGPLKAKLYSGEVPIASYDFELLDPNSPGKKRVF